MPVTQFNGCATRSQRGLSLVELMVGVAVGLLVVAGAATVTATQLSDTRRLVLETQVQQDLRATADIIARELRRGGSNWFNSSTVVWVSGSAVTSNPYDAVTCGGAPCSSSVPSDHVEVNWSTAAAAAASAAFSRAAGPPGVLKLDNGNGSGPQPLTDTSVLDVTAFNVTLNTVSSSQLACAATCPGGGQACWPTVQVRELQFQITGQAVSDAKVVRSIVSSVRLPNDRIVNNNAGGPLCPT